jgi:cytidylate kinase
MITNWWPEHTMLQAGNWSGYFFFWLPTERYVLTVYFRDEQERQVSRKTAAELFGQLTYLYQETTDLSSARHTRSRIRASVLRELGRQTPRNASQIITVEGLSGSGKTTVTEQLAKEEGCVALHTGRYFCSVARSLSCAGLEPTAESVGRALAEIDGLLLQEHELSESLKRQAATMSRNGAIWRLIMSWLWRRAEAALPYVREIYVEGRGFADSEFANADHSFFLHAPDDLRELRNRRKALGGVDTAADSTELSEVRDFADANRMIGRTAQRQAKFIDTGLIPEDEVVRIIRSEVRSASAVAQTENRRGRFKKY